MTPIGRFPTHGRRIQWSRVAAPAISQQVRSDGRWTQSGLSRLTQAACSIAKSANNSTSKHTPSDLPFLHVFVLFKNAQIIEQAPNNPIYLHIYTLIVLLGKKYRYKTGVSDSYSLGFCKSK